MKPGDEGPDQSRELVVKAARRADIMVLDWSIDRDEGTTTAEIIKQILSADNEEERRLRLIAIYTSRLETELILDRLQEVIDQFFDDATLVREQFSLAKGPLRIEIYAKQTAHVVNTATTDKKTEQRPNTEIQERAEHPAIVAATTSQHLRHKVLAPFSFYSDSVVSRGICPPSVRRSHFSRNDEEQGSLALERERPLGSTFLPR